MTNQEIAAMVADIESMIHLRAARSPSINQMRAWANALIAFSKHFGECEPSAVKADHVTVPVEPTEGLLLSMALRHDHGLFMPNVAFTGWQRDIPMKQIIESTMSQMRQLHEEVVGTGFYNPEREANYLKMRDDALAHAQDAGEP